MAFLHTRTQKKIKSGATGSVAGMDLKKF